MEIVRNTILLPQTGSVAERVEPCLESPFDNPKNPKYVLINGVRTPVDTLGPHRLGK